MPDFINHFKIEHGDAVLDVGCAKGFMLHDFLKATQGVEVYGVDISEYAIKHCMPDVKPFCKVANAVSLPFDDNSMDVVISITTLHNLENEDLIKALREVERVSKRGSFITVDAYRNEIEKEAMMNWNLTAKTILHVDEWLEVFAEAGYSGDYYWFMP